MLAVAEIATNSPAYIKRRILWKAVNRVRNRFAKRMFGVWRRQMRKYLNGDALAIREAMRITFVEVGGAFATHEYNKIIDSKALGDVNNSLEGELSNYANTEMSTISASIGNTLKGKADKINNNPDLTDTEKETAINELLHSRAKIVSDNEITRASTIGAGIGASAAILITGQEYVKTWIATIDNRVRDGHDLADGQTVRSNESFIVAGEALKEPLDPAGSAANTANCRCVAAYHKIK